MAIKEKDKAKILRLAKEGKQISRICGEDFPEYNYWEIYLLVYGAGEKSSRGVKWMISKRLNNLSSTSDAVERQRIVNEITDLVWYLYEKHKANQIKLDRLRKIIG